jgi:fatty acid desaturase
MTTATEAPPEIQSPLKRLTPEQIEQIGEEFQKVHDEVFASLGERDAKYIRSIIALHRQLALLGRVLLFGSRWWPGWTAGTASLSMAKILENMEIGHNVMHGQWDWMNDPYINSSTWDWDTASTKEAWKHSHNYVHHTYTNIRGKDKDLGYEIMRIDPHQKWHPVYLLQPLYNLVLMALFEWGVAVHDLDFDAIRKGEKSMKQVRHELKGMAGKARLQITKDYVAWPLISAALNGAAAWLLEPALEKRRAGRVQRLRRRVRRDRRKAQALRAARDTYRATVWADVTANIVRNLWAHSIIFCGHFPDQTYTFSPDEVEDETKGAWYVRQLIGAANIDGSPLFHVISGNLGYQVEHHLYPDMPSSRYGEIAPRVRDICERYGLPYNTGPLHRQLGMVHRTILRLAFPGGKPRPKPGPYQGGTQRPGETGARPEAVGAASNGNR